MLLTDHVQLVLLISYDASSAVCAEIVRQERFMLRCIVLALIAVPSNDIL